MQRSYVVRPEDVTPYSPANHHGTTNYRLISKETVGAEHLEVLLGVIEKNAGALPHAHPDMEQVCYLLEGNATVEIEGVKQDMVAGDCCFFPANVRHTFIATSDTPVKLLVIYSPPYGEDPAKVIR